MSSNVLIIWVSRSPSAMNTMPLRRYVPREVVISENGVDDPGEAALGLPAALRDSFRTSFFSSYIKAAMAAVTMDAVSPT